MNEAQKRADALIQSILSATAKVQNYVLTPNADIDPELIQRLERIDTKLHVLAETT